MTHCLNNNVYNLLRTAPIAHHSINGSLFSLGRAPSYRPTEVFQTPQVLLALSSNTLSKSGVAPRKPYGLWTVSHHVTHEWHYGSLTMIEDACPPVSLEAPTARVCFNTPNTEELFKGELNRGLGSKF